MVQEAAQKLEFLVKEENPLDLPRLSNGIYPDFIKGFLNLRTVVSILENGYVTFNDFLIDLRKYQLKNYNERAKLYGYSLNGQNNKITKGVISNLNDYTKRINDGVKNCDLTLDRLKVIVDDVYNLVYNKPAFNDGFLYE